MTTPKQHLQAAFDALAQGDGRALLELMAEDFTWELKGRGPWAGRYEGKAAVRERLFKPLFAQFETTYRNHATRFIAEGDVVVVECRGDVMTKRGQPYCNEYCYVCTFGADGKMTELIEYLDTQLVADVLEAPAG